MRDWHCIDCGTVMIHSRSSDGWAEAYKCPNPNCELLIEIKHGEPHHCEPNKETITRKAGR